MALLVQQRSVHENRTESAEKCKEKTYLNRNQQPLLFEMERIERDPVYPKNMKRFSIVFVCVQRKNLFSIADI